MKTGVKRRLPTDEPVHLVVDSTGLKVFGAGEDFVATAEWKRKEAKAEANCAARIANCSAGDGIGLKAYLAYRLRII